MSVMRHSWMVGTPQPATRADYMLFCVCGVRSAQRADPTLVKRYQGGFSLIEVLCAILIMGVALVALTRGMTTALGSTKDSEVQTTVVALAAGQLETLRASAVLTDDTTEGDFGDSFPKYKWAQTVSPSDLDGLHQVEVVVQDARSGATLYKLTTLLFDTDYPSSTASEAKQKQRDLEKAKKRNRGRQ
jgi:prepilin-type N-terminal cleavage/methylation domain-containing protein